MARQRGAAGAGQQAEAVAQPLENLLHGQDPRPDRGQLDRQRQAIEPAAQVGDSPPVGLGQLEGAGRRPGAFDEERHSLVLAQPVQRLGGVR